MSFLENIVSVRGSIGSQNNTNGDYSETNEFTVEKYDDENENSNDKNGGSVNNESTTILTTNNNNSQPQQIFHVSVEYEEETKPKVKPEMSTRKRRLITKDAIDISQTNLLNQYSNQTQASASISTKQTPTIIIDDKSQDHVISIKSDAEETKAIRSDETQKLDKFEIFGLFVANEMKSLSSPALQKKLKRKILECILDINDEQDGGNHSTS